MEIIFSRHSEEQNLRRKIPKELVEKTLREPEKVETDKYDPSLNHIEGRFLRVIATKRED